MKIPGDLALPRNTKSALKVGAIPKGFVLILKLSQKHSISKTALRVKGFLMSRVDASTRERWLAEAKSSVEDDDRTAHLMHAWAGWDPKGALEAAVARKDPEIISEVADEASRGPWSGRPYNTGHFGLGVIKDFDVMTIPPDIRPAAREQWYQILEYWGDIDIGETARYGLNYLLRTDYAPRDRLIRFFSGDDDYPDEGDMIDRTFCALRVWAVVQPKGMQTWIATLKDPEMQKALTWLLQNPWGGRQWKSESVR